MTSVHQPVTVSRPTLSEHDGITVVRDDLFPGGTKARVFSLFYADHDEIIYACSALSWSQVSLALKAQEYNKKATIFCAARAERTTQTKEALRLGAKVYEVRPGYLSVVHAQAERYRLLHPRSFLAPLGFDVPEVIDMLSATASALRISPDEVWCASGSGVLTRSLQKAWPKARHVAVQVGKVSDTGRADVVVCDQPFEDEYVGDVPFPCERNYDAKAWALCRRYVRKDRDTLFWNVVGNTLCNIPK